MKNINARYVGTKMKERCKSCRNFTFLLSNETDIRKLVDDYLMSFHRYRSSWVSV